MSMDDDWARVVFLPDDDDDDDDCGDIDFFILLGERQEKGGRAWRTVIGDAAWYLM